MLKNPTPHQIALYSSLRIGGFILLFAVLIGSVVHDNLFGSNWITLVAAVATGLFGLLASYFVTIYYLRKYILRKIKVIYKTIHDRKLTSKEKENIEDLDMTSNIIDEVEKEVEEWAIAYEKQQQQYSSWSEYRRKYIGDISHELKTPIFNVQGYIHTLLDGGLYDKEINHRFLTKAAKNVDRLETIVEDLESITRLESGELILDLQVFDIKVLVEEVFEDLKPKSGEKNIELVFKGGADDHYKVRADRDYSRRILINLVQNSIKYGNLNGRTKVGFYDMDKNILVEVADNGIGIPKKHIPHVFDRFYRVDKHRSRHQGGSGLGLSIVKHIIEAHKQTINVRSTINLGSTFGFTLEKA